MDVLRAGNTKEQAFDIQIHGLVQGVGFRPTVWNLARRYGIRGRVFNNGKGVYTLGGRYPGWRSIAANLLIHFDGSKL